MGLTMSKDSRLGGRVRTRVNAEVRARTAHPVCLLCGYPIDRSLTRSGRPHPLSSVIDEWVPRSKGGPVSAGNCVELHRTCNATKHDHWPITPDIRQRCRDKVREYLEVDVVPGPIIERPW